jgi:hypothetical protein
MSLFVGETLFRTANSSSTRLFYDWSKADGGCWLQSSKDCNAVRDELIAVTHA